MTTNATADDAGDFEHFRACRKAEDYFRFFALPYDPRVVNVSRLNILLHFAGELERLHKNRHEPQTPAQILADYRDALQRSYQAFMAGSALDGGLSTIPQDRAPRPFALTASITVQPRGIR